MKKIAKSFNSLLKKPVEKFGKEDYHKLRVEIKKLRVILDYGKYCDKKFKRKKYFKTFKKIFKQSGKIREYQLEESVLKKYEQYSIAQYLMDIENRIKKEENKIPSMLDKEFWKKANKAFGDIDASIKKLDEQKVDEFTKSVRSKIKDIILPGYLEPEQVHPLRKLLKVDYYNRKFLDLKDQEKITREEDNFLTMLGEWNDCHTMNNQLEKSIAQEKIDPTLLLQLLKLDAEILLNSENLLKDINSRLSLKRLPFFI
ncbi:MAG: CHAD domain-containing protein [Bacteroidota bacterium]|nr:CHAD domain-containing protein [Bacteroidota bacterium]